MFDLAEIRRDKNYKVLADGLGVAWDWKHSVGGGFPGAPSVEGDLIHAMTQDSHLKVQVENGYFDMATPFFATEYTMDHLLLPEAGRSRVHLQYYNAGHMMYLHEEDLANLKANIGSFIDSAWKP